MRATQNTAARRILDEAGGLRAMTGVLAVMIFLTVLAGALGLGTAGAMRSLEGQLAGRLTVQIVDGDPVRRDVVAAHVLAALRAMPGVARAVPVDKARLAGLLRPWLGSDAGDGAVPIPAMIDVDLVGGDGAGDRAARIAASLRAAGAGIRVDRHASWMSPVSGLMRTLTILAAGLVLLMAAATASAVLLAARAGLETHRATIEVMHMLGSTDVQVARIFERRLGLDAAIGGGAGGVVALGVVAFIGTSLSATGSELLGGATIGAGGWVILALIPILFVGLAMLTARLAVLAQLRRTL